jgi:predicted negative regulator of RcsB-dependent stress response
MKKFITFLIIIIILAAAGVVGYLYWTKWKKPAVTPQEEALQSLTETAQTGIESAVQGALPSITTNPLENKPSINPVEQVNPFKEIKTNPFE